MLSTLGLLLTRRMWVTFFLGFSSGLPLLATGSTLQAWLKDEGISIEAIGLVALLGQPYSLKFLWAPFVDRYPLPFLGRRRGWMILTQLLLGGLFSVFAFLDPVGSPALVGICAFLIAFVSATQDIVLDAHRRDSIIGNELGVASSVFVTGYRIGMYAAGAGALILADFVPWSVIFLTLAGLMGVGVIATLNAREPSHVSPPKSLREAVVLPLADFFRKEKALLILLFILAYKVGDTMASNLTTPFYLEMGFSKAQIGAVAKTTGIFALLLGGFLGGIVVHRLGIARALVVCGVLQMLSTLGFAWLASHPGSEAALAIVIAVENITGGMGSSAFIAFMGALCSTQFSATQYALFTSLMGVPRTLLSAPAGYLQAAIGWEQFFVFCAGIAIPGIIISVYLLNSLKLSEEEGNKIEDGDAELL